MRPLLLLLFISEMLTAQNLVVNPGFEENYYARDTHYVFTQIDLIRPLGWTMPTIGSADIIHIPKNVSPGNGANPGFPIPYEGTSMAGFAHQAQYYEYIQGRFTEPMTAGIVYTVSFALANALNSTRDDSKIGICFSTIQNRSSDDQRAGKWKDEADVIFDTVRKDPADSIWTIYTFQYVAKGKERSFIIGALKETNDKMMFAYMCIDSIFIGKPALAVSEIPDSVVIAESAIAAGKTLTLQNIYFETNKSRILPESYQPLYDIILEMKLQPNLKVEIIGHTDKNGNANDNQKLSEQRAMAVKEFFVSKEIDASRITTSGKGSSEPVGDDDAKNRRVEFVFSE